MTSLFDEIKKEHAPLDGWCTLAKAFSLASMVVSLRPETIVEIGIYGGKSLIPLALACKHVGRGVVVGIDPWNNAIAVKEQTSNEHRDWWAKDNLEAKYQKVMAAIERLQLQRFTNIIRNQSQNVTPPKQIGILHVDGSHGPTATNDIVRFSPHVVMGGLVVLDDLRWEGGAVSIGEQKLLQTGFKKLYALEEGAAYQRIK